MLILARFALSGLIIEIDSLAQFAAVDYSPDQHSGPLGLKIGALLRPRRVQMLPAPLGSCNALAGTTLRNLENRWSTPLIFWQP